MVKEYFKNPVFLAVIVLSLVFYSGLFNIPEKFSYYSIVPEPDVQILKGAIMSSPVKISNKKYYRTSFKVTEAGNKELCGSASGIVQLLIPAEKVEAFYPGKLYTKTNSQTEYIYESGGSYIFTGKFINSQFYAKECLSGYFNNSIFGKLDKLRARLRLQFKRLMFQWKDGGGLLLALLCGSREYTEDSIAEYFRNAGLSHILALSGMHLSMFSSIAFFFGNKIGRKKLTFIIRIITLFCFISFAGFSPSLTRAFICSMLLIFASIASVETPDMVLILCFSFLLQCVLYPLDIHNAGFMLSYSALLGILLFGKFFCRIYDRFLPKNIALSLSSSTGAQIFTMPLGLKMFGTFCPVGIIATIVVSPMVTIFIYSGLIFIISSLIFPALSNCSGILLNFEYTILKYVVGFFSLAPRINI